MSDAHDPYAALRYRDYRLLLAGGVLASIGAEMQAVAVGWELYVRTHSAAYLGLAGLVQFLPVLLLALPAGQAADHHSRKRLFQLAQATAALAPLGLAALSFWEWPAELDLSLSAVGGRRPRLQRSCALGAAAASRSARRLLGNAVTWNSSGWQIANVAGPALGGAVIAVASRISSRSMRPPPTPGRFVLLSPASSCWCPSALAKPRGVRLWRAPGVAAWRACGLSGVPTCCWPPSLWTCSRCSSAAPRLCCRSSPRTFLHVGPDGLGWLRGLAGFRRDVDGLGAGAPTAAEAAGTGVAVGGGGVRRWRPSLSACRKIIWLSFAMLALTGALDNISVVVRGTLLQTLTPDEMRGRVSAVNSLFISSSNELGGFESGETAALFGAVASVVGGGVGTILVVLLVMLHWPRLVRLGPLHALLPVEAKAKGEKL